MKDRFFSNWRPQKAGSSSRETSEVFLEGRRKLANRNAQERRDRNRQIFQGFEEEEKEKEAPSRVEHASERLNPTASPRRGMAGSILPSKRRKISQLASQMKEEGHNSSDQQERAEEEEDSDSSGNSTDEEDQQLREIWDEMTFEDKLQAKRTGIAPKFLKSENGTRHDHHSDGGLSSRGGDGRHKRDRIQKKGDADRGEDNDSRRKRTDRKRPRELSAAGGRPNQLLPCIASALNSGELKGHRRYSRDPRFDSMAGEFSESGYRAAYGFIDNMRRAEIADLKEKVGNARLPEEKEALRQELNSVSQKLKLSERAEALQKARSEQRKKELEAVKMGKKPFYPKRSDQKRLERVELFKELESAGRLEKYMTKRRQKRASKDRRMIPLPASSSSSAMSIAGSRQG